MENTTNILAFIYEQINRNSTFKSGTFNTNFAIFVGINNI